jgi:hypothetical protein
MPVKDPLEEIKRAMDPHFNYSEPPMIAKVTRVYTGSADVKYSFVDAEGTTQTIVDRKVPVIKPAYGTGSINLTVGDKVMLIFEGGSIASAYIVGKL